IEVAAGEPARFLISHHVSLNDDDGSVAGAACWSRNGDEILISPGPGTDLGRRFPNGNFRIAPAAGTRFERIGGDELLFLDGGSRQQPFLCIVTPPGSRAGLSSRGNLVTTAVPTPLLAENSASLTPRVTVRCAARNPDAEQLAQLADIMPWFAQNALIHYLAPRGLEQYSGG